MSQKIEISDRIAFVEDEEAGPSSPRIVPPEQVRRRRSSASLSIRPPPRRRSMDASAAVPIEYRALSIDVEDAQRAPKSKAKPAVVDLASLTWHTLAPDALAQQLTTSLRDGLSAEQALRRAQQHGRNVPSPPPTHRVRTVAGCFLRGFGPVLLVASVLVFVSWKPLGQPPAVANLALAIVLLAIFVIQGAFNLWQDWSSSRVMASIHTMLPDACLVVRDGSVASVPAAALVPGDVLLVKAGNRLPADVRFVEASPDAKFDRALLTGEAKPLAATVTSTDANYLETGCIGLQGTHCVSGTCRAVVVATGDRTVFGRIARLTNAPKTGRTTLEREIFNFTALLVSLMVGVIVLVLIVWGAWLRPRHHDWISVPTLIVSCVSVAVAFLPEGLPVALTASMTIGANTMRRNRILCKSLKTVETLGAVSVICSDKTGTLTQNKMVVTVYAQGAAATVCTEEAAPASPALAQLHAVAGLCNDGQFDAATADRPLRERTIHGDATDQAVLRFAESLGSVASLRRVWTTRCSLAFNSKNKYMLRVLAPAQEDAVAAALPQKDDADAAVVRAGALLLTIKGAPEILLERVTSYVHPVSGATVPLDAGTRAAVDATKDAWSAQGRRVLLLARKTVVVPPAVAADDEAEMQRQARTGLTLVGLVGLVDPPRPESAGVVQTLRGAGVRVFMVTGDYALTAQAIAAECGILTRGMPVDRVADLPRGGGGGGAGQDDGKTIKRERTAHNERGLVVSGPELLGLDEAQWEALSRYEAIVFARTTPEQKLRIVRELRARTHVVGMTGDGVNDAPALRAADIGIAMGSGSDMAVEAADMVLLDSSFSGIVEALRCGRTLFDNLRKTVAYLLPAGSFGELWPVLTNVWFGLPQILSSFLMIVICLFTDAAGAIAIAYEAPEADVLARPPRVPGRDRLVDGRLVLQSYGVVGVLETVCSFAMAYWYLQRRGIPFFGALWFRFGELPADGPDADAYAEALNVASSIYFVNLVVMQWFNLFAMRTRRLSLVQHPPLGRRATQNPFLFVAVLFAVVMVFFWLYVPAFQSALGNRPVPVEHWFLPMAFGLGILLLDEARKFFVRKYPKGVLARIAW